MKNLYKINTLLILIFSFLYSDFDSNVSYELKYAKDESDSTEYFENIYDISFFFDDYYFFSQLEYKDPALLGPKTDSFSSAVNFFYLQHSKEKYDITIGNLFLMQGRGLSIHTYEDRNIDYDNSLLGIETIYHLKNNVDIISIFGKKNIKSRLIPDETIPTISVKNTLGSLGVYASFDYFSIHYQGMSYKQEYSKETLNQLRRMDGVLGDYLKERFSSSGNEFQDYEMQNLEHNLGVEFSLANLDIYYEKSLVFYNKIMDERITGYRDYLSFYFNLFNFNIIYEYKNYNTPYLYNVFCNGPTTFREPNSALTSRNSHSVNFSNEYGHQLEIIRSFDKGMNFIFNYSFAYHHLENQSEPNLFETFEYIYDTSELVNQADFKPFRQLYIELSDWNYKDDFYYKIGYDHYYEITKLGYGFVETKTYPMQFTYKFKGGNSFSTYLEFQNFYNQDNSNLDLISNYKYTYLSPSYNHYGKWILTFFSEQGRYQTSDYKFKTWSGLDFTYNIKNSNQLSLFLGSQVGGLVCANGTCVQQPDFEDGFKITYRTSF